MQMRPRKGRVVPRNPGLRIMSKHRHKTIHKWSAVDIHERLHTRGAAICYNSNSRCCPRSLRYTYSSEHKQIVSHVHHKARHALIIVPRIIARESSTMAHRYMAHTKQGIRVVPQNGYGLNFTEIREYTQILTVSHRTYLWPRYPEVYVTLFGYSVRRSTVLGHESTRERPG